MGKSSIEWTMETWNPVVGCSVISPGCTNCYAMRMAARINKMTLSSHYEGLTKPSKAGPVWTGKIALAPKHIVEAPLSRRKPTTWFVNSMSDLFHESLPDEVIDRVFAVMALCPRHTFQVLTKRSKRMRGYLTKPRTDHQRDVRNRLAWDNLANVMDQWHPDWVNEGIDGPHRSRAIGAFTQWPLRNVWLGVSTEDQQRADERIPDLLATPAAVRFISAEPLLGPISLGRSDYVPGDRQHLNISHGFISEKWWCHGPSKLNWVIVGGESGPKSRDFHLSWAKSLIEQCQSAGVPVFMKQVGANAWDDISYAGSTPAFKTRDRKGGDPAEWPACLQVRQMPAQRTTSPA